MSRSGSPPRRSATRPRSSPRGPASRGRASRVPVRTASEPARFDGSSCLLRGGRGGHEAGRWCLGPGGLRAPRALRGSGRAHLVTERESRSGWQEQDVELHATSPNDLCLGQGGRAARLSRTWKGPFRDVGLHLASPNRIPRSRRLTSRPETTAARVPLRSERSFRDVECNLAFISRLCEGFAATGGPGLLSCQSAVLDPLQPATNRNETRVIEAPGQTGVGPASPRAPRCSRGQPRPASRPPVPLFEASARHRPRCGSGLNRLQLARVTGGGAAASRTFAWSGSSAGNPTPRMEASRISTGCAARRLVPFALSSRWM